MRESSFDKIISRGREKNFELKNGEDLQTGNILYFHKDGKASWPNL